MAGAIDAILTTAHARPGSEMRLKLEEMAGVESSRHPSVMWSRCLVLLNPVMWFYRLPGSYAVGRRDSEALTLCVPVSAALKQSQPAH